MRVGPEAGRLHRRIDVEPAAALGQLDGKAVLHEDLPAGKGHAASRVAVKEHIALEDVEHLLDRILGSGHDQRLAGTVPRAQSAVVAQRAVDDRRLSRLLRYDSLGTNPGAEAAGKAIVGLLEQLPRRTLRGRVGTPQATQRAAFEKDGRPRPRAVMQAVVLDILNERLHAHAPTASGCRILPGDGCAARRAWRFRRCRAAPRPSRIQAGHP